MSVFFWSKLRILREFDRPVLFLKGWKRKLVSAICIIANRILSGLIFQEILLTKDI